MRWRLLLLVAATTSAVVLAFIIPLVVLIHDLAENRAVGAARQQAGTIALVIGDRIPAPNRLEQVIADVGAGSGDRTSVVLPDGTVIGAPTDDPAIDRAVAGQAFTEPNAPNGDAIVYQPAVTAEGTAVVRVAVPERVQHAGIVRATLTISGLGLALLVVAVFAADRMAVRLSAPIRSVVVTAEALREGDLETRAAEEGPAEVVAVARALNRLASRIAQLLASERDAVADLSHRLRTPVTALRLDADQVADPEVAERLHEHVEQLERTVSAIVRDARRPVRVSLAALCDVSRVVADRVAFWSALAEEQGRRLRLELPRQPAYAKIDAADLTDAVDVLIDNVFAHTQDGVAVEIWVTADPRQGVVITVEDAGPGLPGGDVVGRGRSGAGSTGLGLDIVRRAALASGGRLELGRSRMGGALVRMVLGPPER